VQVIVEVEVEAGTYASEQYQSRMAAPNECPNCGIAQSLEAHGHYWRWLTAAPCGRVLRMAVLAPTPELPSVCFWSVTIPCCPGCSWVSIAH